MLKSPEPEDVSESHEPRYHSALYSNNFNLFIFGSTTPEPVHESSSENFSTSFAASSSSSCTPSPKNSRKRKISKSDEVDELLIRSLSTLQDRAVQKETKETDAEYLYGQMVCATLQRFNPRQRAAAKLRIQQLLNEIEFPPDFPMSNNFTPPQYTPNNTYYNN